MVGPPLCFLPFVWWCRSISCGLTRQQQASCVASRPRHDVTERVNSVSYTSVCIGSRFRPGAAAVLCVVSHVKPPHRPPSQRLSCQLLYGDPYSGSGVRSDHSEVHLFWILLEDFVSNKRKVPASISPPSG